ncbi:hypothetical protein HB162lentus_04460 [Mammaliicoccus lentus]
MTYEYEGKSNISFSIGNKLHFWNVTDDNLREELQEVYDKAKAWDKYLESTVRQEAIDEFGEDDPRVDFAVELTKEIYMEDK